MDLTGENQAGARPANGDYESLRLLDVDQLCELIRTKKSWIYDAVEAGKIPAIRLGKQIRFREADLVAYLSGAATASPAARERA
ncbi:helix-turn-helix domain-containing protein [Actinocorallia sp. API 0066]|uniref:helix-turn-helix domain-containing protein n=1 Tax=Actinocorallia sp. API 0066 TaxID=2896846 RepID=UPI001E488F64|nr:helix-turn-helix domain-containing protein [Actinocorallia sp. API 0066]MCD0449450.1 helix-turn-helix domain-containing protein [Actinocorallia sp. API 0066]